MVILMATSSAAATASATATTSGLGKTLRKGLQKTAKSSSRLPYGWPWKWSKRSKWLQTAPNWKLRWWSAYNEGFPAENWLNASNKTLVCQKVAQTNWKQRWWSKTAQQFKMAQSGTKMEVAMAVWVFSFNRQFLSIIPIIPKKVELLIRFFEPFWILRVFSFFFEDVLGSCGPSGPAWAPGQNLYPK